MNFGRISNNWLTEKQLKEPDRSRNCITKKQTQKTEK